MNMRLPFKVQTNCADTLYWNIYINNQAERCPYGMLYQTYPRYEGEDQVNM